MMQIKCTNCGGDVAIEERTTTVVCEYCNTTLFADLISGIPQIVLKADVLSGHINGRIVKFLQRFEITSKPEIIEKQITYYPYWRFKSVGKKQNYLVAASGSPAYELSDLYEPSGQVDDYNVLSSGGAKFVEPDILQDEASAITETIGVSVVLEKKIQALVYLPVAKVKYKINKDEHELFIELVSGNVVTDDLPARPQNSKSRTFEIVTIVSFLLFLLLSYKTEGVWLFFLMLVCFGILHAGITYFLKRTGW